MELETSGYVERTILHALDMDGLGGVHLLTGPELSETVARVRHRDLDTHDDPENPAARASATRRACRSLAEKGLIVDAEIAYDQGIIGPHRGKNDGRVTEWLLTEDGREELQRLNENYAGELRALMRRYGRLSSI